MMIVKFMANALLYALGLFSAAMVLLGVRGADPERAWAFITLGIVGFIILAVMIWGRRMLIAMEERGKQS